MALKVWHGEIKVKEWADAKILCERVIDLDLGAKSRVLNEELVKLRMDWICKLKEMDFSSRLDLIQKVRVKWAVEGDAN